MTETDRTVHKQLIDQHREFHRDAIQFATHALGQINRDYHTVAIIGVQNSGKSTLLNHLFGTNFSVLKEMAGTRTTRGIWVSVDKKENFIVFDVEGNDSMDRAEEQDYQKMVATYALVTANVLIINVWSKSLGQYSGTQYQTLKVIMDICITQFRQQSPKTILFCVRDFNEQYDEQREIKRKIIKDVNDIWRKLDKPLQLKQYDEKPQKFFSIEVAVLRRYKPETPQKFNEDVNKLRQKFVNPQNKEGYVFAKQKKQFNLPIEDMPTLTENAWNSIKTNKKLNLPNQKDQLASFRCSSIMGEVSQNFQKELGELTESNLITDFGKLRQKYLENFDKTTYHYPKHIVDDKKKQLTDNINDLLKKTAIDKISQKTKQIVQQFQAEAGNFTQSSKKNLPTQMKDVYSVKMNDLTVFMRNLNFDIADRKQRIDELSQKLHTIMDQTKQKVLKGSQDLFQNESSRSIRLLTSEVIKDHFGIHLWTEAKRATDANNRKLVDIYVNTYNWATGTEIAPQNYSDLYEKLNKLFKQSVKSELQKSLQGKILDIFKQKYSKDEHGQTINFNLKTEQQISKHFDVIREQIMDIIDKINEYVETSTRISFIGDETPQQQTLFEPTWLSNVTQQIDKQMIAQYQKTIRRKKQSQMNNVPWWMFILILYFVYDDIWFTQEDSPVIHYVLVSILLLLGILLAIGQGKVIKETVNLVTEKLKNRFAFLR